MKRRNQRRRSTQRMLRNLEFEASNIRFNKFSQAFCGIFKALCCEELGIPENLLFGSDYVDISIERGGAVGRERA